MILLLAAQLCFAQQVHDAYAAMDTAGVAALHARAPSREDSLVALYRWYALSRDESLLRRLPEPAAGAGARELALLSALWAYRIPGSAPWNVMRYGRRSQGLLNGALRADSSDPLVVLIDAQALMFRPGIAGGDVNAAVQRLKSLSSRLHRESACGVTADEADVWLWYGATRAGDADSTRFERELRARRLPLLYQRFLPPGD